MIITRLFGRCRTAKGNDRGSVSKWKSRSPARVPSYGWMMEPSVPSWSSRVRGSV
jgi:hypothetical protein